MMVKGVVRRTHLPGLKLAGHAPRAAGATGEGKLQSGTVTAIEPRSAAWDCDADSDHAMWPRSRCQ